MSIRYITPIRTKRIEELLGGGGGYLFGVGPKMVKRGTRGCVFGVMDANYLGFLFRRHSASLALYARQWTATPEDVVQEAYMKLVRQVPTPEQPVAWLYRVVRNAAISDARSVRRRRTHEARFAGQVVTMFEYPAEPGGFDPVVLTAALSRIPDEQREIIVAHVWGGLTFEQIGEIVGLSAPTAWRRYSAGLTILRSLLGNENPSGETAAVAPDPRRARH